MASATVGDLIRHLFFVQEYADDNHYFVSWSLCVEEHFYLLLPAVVWAIRRVERAWFVLALVVGVEAIAVVGRVVAYPTEADPIPMVTHLRWHGLFIGLGFAYLAHTRAALWDALGRIAPWLGVAGIVATIAVMASIGAPPNRWMFVGVPTIGTWTLAMVFLPCVHPASAWSRFSVRGLSYAGELTYSIYLVHAVIPKAWLGAKISEAPLQGLAIRVAVTLGCALALHHLVERPAMALRERILARWPQRDSRSKSSSGSRASS
jgi:peptidoglycan/LPS O-acetylase OafA/YrhL